MKVETNEFGETEITIDRGVTALDINARESCEAKVMITLNAKKARELLLLLRNSLNGQLGKGKKSIDRCPE